MKSQHFKSEHCYTLQLDQKTHQSYIKIPIVNLAELALLHEALLDNILLLNKLGHTQYKHEQMQNIIHWLSKIVSNSYPYDELCGLSQWLQQD